MREPMFAHGDQRLYYLSRRPLEHDPIARERIWFDERTPSGWSEPHVIDDVVTAHPTHWQFSFTAAGDLYFTSEIEGVRGEQDIFVSRWRQGSFTAPESVGDGVNSDEREFCPFVADDTLDTLSHPGRVGSTRTAGIDLNKPRLRAVLQAVIALAALPHGFTASQLADKVRHLTGWDENQYQPRQAAYDLKKLRGKQWVEKIGNSRRYQPHPTGLKTMAALLTLREKVIKPVLAGAGKPKGGRKPQNQTHLDTQYRKVQTEMHHLLHMLGMAV